jgi:hypothetical protein
VLAGSRPAGASRSRPAAWGTGREAHGEPGAGMLDTATTTGDLLGGSRGNVCSPEQ